MTGNEEFEPLDELFRKTFQDLPDKPSASGWDTPSPRVWQRVQTEIKPPASTGWATQTWVIIAIMAVVLSVGLYFGYGRKIPAPQSAPAPTEQPVALPPAPTVAPTQEVSPTTPAEKIIIAPGSAKSRPATVETRSNPAVNSSNAHSTEPGRVQATPLPGSKPVSPNSTEREKSQDGKEN